MEKAGEGVEPKREPTDFKEQSCPSNAAGDNRDTEGEQSENAGPSDCELCRQHFDSKVELKEHEMGLAHMLIENARISVHLETKPSTPKERARPLDQGLSETYTLHAIANATSATPRRSRSRRSPHAPLPSSAGVHATEHSRSATPDTHACACA